MLSGPVIGGPCAGAKRIDAPTTWDGRILRKNHSDPNRRIFMPGRYVWHPIGCKLDSFYTGHWCWEAEQPKPKPKPKRPQSISDFVTAWRRDHG